MIRSLSTGITGLRSHQVMMDVLSNDIANVNTVGYKAQRASFKDVLFQTQKPAAAAGGGLGSQNAAQIGLGAQLGSIENMMAQGALTNTGNPLDVAISGEGFFRVADDNTPPFANVQVTRAGNFQLDEQGRLTTSEGYFVLGNTVDAATGAPTATESLLTIPTSAKSVSIDTLGLVSIIDATGAPQKIGFLSLAKVPNPSGLERVTGNRWRESLSSGPALASNANLNGLGVVASGSLELSNVDLSQEFSNMILAQRGFQANSRIITTADEILNTLVNLKR